MKINGYLLPIFLVSCVIGCANASIFDVSAEAPAQKTEDSLSQYEYSESVLKDSNIKLDKDNTVQLYRNNTPDALYSKALREEHAAAPSGNTSNGMLLNAKKNISHPDDLVMKIENLNNRLDEMNKTLLTEFKRINARFDTLNTVSQQLVQNNIQDVNKKNTKTFSLSQEMQKTFSDSTTRDLKDIPTATYHN